MPQCPTVLIVALLGATTAGSVAAQRGPASPIPTALRVHLDADRFQVVSSIRGLPLGVRETLQTMWQSGLDIAEPGAPFQGAAGNRTLPSRRLIAAGCAADHHCLVYYERAGATAAVAALFQWSPEGTEFESGGTTPAGLKTIGEVQRAFVSGDIGLNLRW